VPRVSSASLSFPSFRGLVKRSQPEDDCPPLAPLVRGPLAAHCTVVTGRHRTPAVPQAQSFPPFPTQQRELKELAILLGEGLAPQSLEALEEALAQPVP